MNVKACPNGLLQVSVYDLGGGQQELAGEQGAKQQAVLDDKKRTVA